MKAKELIEGVEEREEIAVSFPPGVVLVTGAEEVRAGSLFYCGNGKVYLKYICPHYTVGGQPQAMVQIVGSEWIIDSGEFERVK